MFFVFQGGVWGMSPAGGLGEVTPNAGVWGCEIPKSMNVRSSAIENLVVGIAGWFR